MLMLVLHLRQTRTNLLRFDHQLFPVRKGKIKRKKPWNMFKGGQTQVNALPPLSLPSLAGKKMKKLRVQMCEEKWDKMNPLPWVCSPHFLNHQL